MSSAELAELIGQAGLGRIVEELLELASPSIRLAPGVGRSRLGGEPDLPAGMEWPQRNGVPLAHIAQLFFGELQPFDRTGVLPQAGSLSFFYDAAQQPWGFDPADRGGAIVVHRPETDEAQRRPASDALPKEARFGEIDLEPRRDLTLPPFGSEAIASLGFDERETDAYFELLGRLEGDSSDRCLGYPDQIQGDMQLEAQLVTHGIYLGDSSGYQDPRAQELAAGAASWRLLLQVDSHEEIGMFWGDLGRLYYWIREEDLRRGAFQASWLILQCT